MSSQDNSQQLPFITTKSDNDNRINCQSGLRNIDQKNDGQRERDRGGDHRNIDSQSQGEGQRIGDNGQRWINSVETKVTTELCC